jgi:predicted nucleic acid-binding protein
MYIDTSALVKLYVEEPDSEACEATVAGMTLVSSRLLHCEFRSALLGKISLGNISSDSGAKVWELFESDVATANIRLIPLDDLLLRDASEILGELHPKVRLRTLDAVHLATYLSVETGPIFTKDRRMIQAATQMGLSLAV